MYAPAKKVFGKVLSDAIKNIIFYGIGALVIAFIGNTLQLRIFGLVLAALFTIIVFISLIPFLFSFFAGLVAIPLAVYERIKGDKKALIEESYLTAGTIALFVENSICYTCSIFIEHFLIKSHG